jgi:tRNA(fMet)-specific endonuclease VapC
MTDVAGFLSRFHLLSYTEPAMDRFDQLDTLKVRIGKNDQRIAAIALEAGGIVVTRNRRDFGRVQGLVIEDWSV